MRRERKGCVYRYRKNEGGGGKPPGVKIHEAKRRGVERNQMEKSNRSLNAYVWIEKESQSIAQFQIKS